MGIDKRRLERLEKILFGDADGDEKTVRTPQEMLEALLEHRDRMALGKTNKGHWPTIAAAIEDYRGRVAGASDGESVSVSGLVEAVLASIREADRRPAPPCPPEPQEGP